MGTCKPSRCQNHKSLARRKAQKQTYLDYKQHQTHPNACMSRARTFACTELEFHFAARRREKQTVPSNAFRYDFSGLTSVI